tara:strand:- start:24382 stop:26190 length:1809 start_codon:yes stop_codon:yes gene_type:complete
MLEEAMAFGLFMEAGLGRTVTARYRFARQWALGDRKNPVAATPALVLLDGDDDIDPQLAPFRSTTNDQIPATLTFESRLPLSPPDFREPSPKWSVSIGHVLPPSLDEADAGEPAGTAQILPISWQRLNHDASLTDSTLKPDVVVLVDAVQLASQPGKLVEAITTLKRRFPGSLLWTPGLGGPDNLAVLTWFGVDLFDLARSRQAAVAGVLLTEQGPRHVVDSMNESADMEAQISHWKLAIASVRGAMASDQMRSLADRQSLTSPRLVEHLRRHDFFCRDIPGILSSHVSADFTFPCHSVSVQSDPLIADWESFITTEYCAPEGLDSILILLPCSARKPYRLSKSHGRFIRAIGTSACHEVMVTSPLGLVPRDLEEVWPAGHYDVPVTGDWTGDELSRIQRMFQSLVKRQNYQKIINHSGIDFTHESVEIIDSRQGDSAGSHEALERLSEAVKKAVDDLSPRGRKTEKILLDNFSSIARKQMNSDAWIEGLKVRGKPPRYRLERGNTQMALWSIDRSGFSLPKAIIPTLAELKALPEVHLCSGVVWRGDIFGQIVDSFDVTIRAGSDLLVLQDGQVIGLARAHAPAWEWPSTPGRLAKSHQRL